MMTKMNDAAVGVRIVAESVDAAADAAAASAGRAQPTGQWSITHSISVVPPPVRVYTALRESAGDDLCV